MTALDYLVLFGTILAIAVYGILRTRGRRNLHDYLRGKKQSWFAIGLSVMATQASAITFLSTPGQAYADGMSFLQNYFALPLALVIIAAFFLPFYRRLNVYTAYEYLGTRFDKKTRLLAASIFLIQRGFGAGLTIYAPAIVLSTVFGWSLTATIIASSVVVTIYTLAGGSDAVTHTQKYQLAIIFGGMITAFIILVSKIPCSFTDALTLAGHFGKTNAVTFSPAAGHTFWSDRYTFWSGMLAGLFLMLSYFGTDQSQVQRYISGDNLRESRLGLMFNALFKIPMQFFVLLLGVMLFVFYMFHPAPIAFNQPGYSRSTEIAYANADGKEAVDHLEEHYSMAEDRSLKAVDDWFKARRSGNQEAEAGALDDAILYRSISGNYRMHMVEFLKTKDPSFNGNDNDYVFITFILDNLPHGLIGLLVACFFAAALNAKAAELNALASCTTVDFYRYLIHPPQSPPSPTAGANVHGDQTNPSPTNTDAASQIENQKSKIENPPDRHFVRASRLFTAFWGLVALLFALFCHLSENLIQATNILSSLFYPILLSLFLCGFFLKFLSATPVFLGALAAQAVVLTLYFNVPDSTLSYLWYNPIGVAASIITAIILQPLLGKPTQPPGFPISTINPPPNL